MNNNDLLYEIALGKDSKLIIITKERIKETKEQLNC